MKLFYVTPDSNKNQALALTEELELLKGFPSTFQKRLILAKLKEVEAKIEPIKRDIEKKLAVIKKEPAPVKRQIYLIAFKAFNRETLSALERLLDRQKRLKLLLNAISSTHSSTHNANPINFELFKERARQVSILDLARWHGIEVKKTGKNYIARCPFHEDRHPSFVLYPETNTFHCFSCKRTGDVIKLHQLLTGCDFKSAIRELSEQF